MAYYRKRNGKWNAQVRRAGIKTISKTFTQKADAIKWANSIELSLEKGVFIDYESSKKVKLSELYQRYKEEVTPTLKGRVQDESKIKILTKNTGHILLSEVSSSLLAEYRDNRLKVLSPQTVKHELSMINRVLKIAVNEWGYTLPNGIPTVKYPTLPIGRTRRLNKEEEQRLFLHADPYILNIIKVLQNTAMRTGELSKLNKDDINFDTKLADLIDTKNGDDRTIPLNSTAINSLNELIKDSTTDKVLCFSSSYISHRFTKLCRTANIDDMVLHSFRHEAISRLFERGFSIMEVSTISGHRSLASLKRYTHINPSSLLDRLG